jgi:hypothetical protein
MSAKQMNSSLLSGIFNGCNGSGRVGVQPKIFSKQIWDLAACSREVDEMKIKSEKQSSNVHEPGAEGSSSPLPFDPKKYRKYLAVTGWSKKVQDECLETLWNMMSTFVDLAWGATTLFRPF